MKKGLLKIFLALIVTLLSITTVYGATDVPERASDKDWVVDNANVLDEETEITLELISQDLADKYGACIAVLTVDYYSGSSLNAYATNVFNSWKLGDKDKQNGILLVLAIEDDDYYMIEGRGLEHELTISEMDDLLFYNLEPDFAAKDYNSGVKKVVEATYDWLCDYYGMVNPVNPPDTKQDNGPVDVIFTAVLWVLFLLVLIFIVNLIYEANTRKYYNRNYHNGSYRNYNSSYSSSRSTYRPSKSYSSSSYSSSRSSSSSYSSSGSSHHTYSSSRSSSSSSSSSSRSSGSSYGGSSRGAGAGRHR